MAIQTFEDESQFNSDTGVVTNAQGVETQPITPERLQPATPFNITEVQEQPVFPVADLEVPEIELTQPEQEAQGLTEQLQELTGGLTGQSAFRAEQEQEAGLPALQTMQTDLTAQLKAIQNEAQAIPLQLQQEATGRGITVGGLRPLQTARLRTNAIQALSVSSLLEASRGNIGLAQQQVDRAVAQKFDPIREQIAAKSANLQLILQSPEFSLEDKKRAQTQLNAQQAKEKQVAKQEAEELAIKNVAVEAASKGVDAVTLGRIQAAPSAAEATRLASEAGVFDLAEEQKTQIVEVGGRKVLIDTQTGETIKDLGLADIADDKADTQVIKTDDGRSLLIDTQTGETIKDFSTSPSTDPITGVPTDPSKVIDGFDFTSYATDPNWGNAVGNIFNNIKFETPQDIDNYIQSVSPNSPVTSEEVQNASEQFGVSWEILTAIMQQESQFGTLGVGARGNNPGNVGNTDSLVAGGDMFAFPDLQSGVNAIAQNIARRKITGEGELSSKDVDVLTAQLGKVIYGTRIANEESARIERIIKATLKEQPDANTGEIRESIMRGLFGYEPTQNQELGDSLISTVMQSIPLADFDMFGLSRLLSDNKPVEAIKKVENALMAEVKKIDPDGFIGEPTVKTAVDRAVKLRNLISGADKTKVFKDVENPIGVVKGTMQEWMGRLRSAEAQKIKSQVVSQVAEMRNRLSGTAVTESEERFLEPLIPKISDTPANFMIKLNQLAENPLVELNNLRETIGLPQLDENSLTDNNLRLDLYRGEQTQETETQTFTIGEQQVQAGQILENEEGVRVEVQEDGTLKRLN